MHRTSYLVPSTTTRSLPTRSRSRWAPWFVVGIVLLAGLTFYAAIALPGTGSATSGHGPTEPRIAIHPATTIPNITLTPTHGFVGTMVTVAGSGYQNNTTVTITFGARLVPTSCVSGTNNSTDPGNFSCQFVVPSSHAGSYLVNATNATTFANATFIVDPPMVALSALHGFVGNTITATGVGYVANVTLRLTFDSSNLTCQPGGNGTGSAGNFSCLFLIPPLRFSTYPVNVTDGFNTGQANFTIDPPTLAVNPASGNVGLSPVKVSGKGYAPGVHVTLLFGTQDISSCAPGTLNVNSSGYLKGCTFPVPLVRQGTEQVTASDGVNTGYTNFTVGNSSLSLAPAVGNVSTSVDATGDGFNVSTALSLTFSGAAITTCTSGSLATNSVGALACTFSVPTTTAGNHTVTASDGTNPASAIFGVTSRLTLSPATGGVGSVVTATGTGFNGTAAYSVKWNATTTLCSGTTGATGGFSCNLLPVPAAPEGAHTLTVVQGTNPATAVFSVTPGLVLSPAAGIVGAPVGLVGTGLLAATTYTFCFLATVTHCSAGNPTFVSDAAGNVPASTSIMVPSDAPGPYFVDISIGSAVIVSASFTLTSASVVVAPSTGPVGTVVNITGSGYGDEATYAYCFLPSTAACSGSGLTTFVSSAGGSIPTGTSLTAPEDPDGIYYVDVSFGSSFVSAGEFTLTSFVVLTPSTGIVGASVAAVGTGFDSSASYTLLWDAGAQLCAGTTNAVGEFSCTFAVPYATAGVHSAGANEGSILFLAGFTVLPSLLLAPTSGPVGSASSAIGAGFAGSVGVTVTWDAISTLCTGNTNSTGAFSCGFTVPSSPAGAHNISATQSLNRANASFVVTPKVTLSPNSGIVGTSVTLTGAGFDGSTPFSVLWNSSIALCSASTSPSGGLNCTFFVPATHYGLVTITTREGTYSPTATFTVGVSLLISPTTGVVGTSANATGSGFEADAAYTVSWDTGAALCAGVTNSLGGFTCPFTIPNGRGGAHTVTVVEGSNTASVILTATPFLQLSLSSGTVGSIVTATGEGFATASPYSLMWNSTTSLCTGTTTANGGFVCTFNIPAAPGGSATVTAEGSGYSPTATLTVAPNLSVSPSAGPVGSSVTAYGSGFGSRAAYSVNWNSTTTLCSGTTNSNGGFTCTFTIPASDVGTFTITVGGVYVVNPTEFTVTTSPVTPNSSPPFQWWLVAVAAIVVIALLLLALIAVRRRGPSNRPKPKTVEPWADSGAPSGSPGTAPGTAGAAGPAAATPGALPASVGAAAATAAPVPAEPVQDIDVLIERLEQMSLEMFKKTPKQLSEEPTEDEKN
ncbi:MAG TPA: hypothetical protein VK424_08865 [Thermoplasmata archaeon]|nr:hypothetical protein [Thermoplasmata archaeon]